MFYTKQRRFIHCSLKKRAQNGVVLTALYMVFSPGRTAGRGRRFFFLLTTSPPPLYLPKKTDTTHTHDLPPNKKKQRGQALRAAT
jgi:hypothetical protein